jgi:hypothetical protein
MMPAEKYPLTHIRAVAGTKNKSEAWLVAEEMRRTARGAKDAAK